MIFDPKTQEKKTIYTTHSVFSDGLIIFYCKVLLLLIEFSAAAKNI